MGKGSRIDGFWVGPLPSLERLAELTDSGEDGVYPGTGATLSYVLAAAAEGDPGLGRRLAELAQIRRDVTQPGLPPSAVCLPMAVRVAGILEEMVAGDVDALRRGLAEWADGEAGPAVELYWLATCRAEREDEEDKAERLRQVAAIARAVAEAGGYDVNGGDSSSTAAA